MSSEKQTYEEAGVSLGTANALVERLRAAVESTGAIGFGAFAGLYPLDDKRLLAASTDSVGTKLIVAANGAALRNCGADLAAHCINDVITSGADPLLLLDYVAATASTSSRSPSSSKARPRCAARQVRAHRRGDRRAPGVYREGARLAALRGLVERERL